jgi:hypothetical protein
MSKRGIGAPPLPAGPTPGERHTVCPYCRSECPTAMQQGAYLAYRCEACGILFKVLLRPHGYTP